MGERNMLKKTTLLTLLVLSTMLTATLFWPITKAATDEQIEASGAAAVAFLAGIQKSDGSWGYFGNSIAKAGLVLLKFVVRAQELGLDPFDNDPLSPTYYEYADNTIAGFDYLLSSASEVPISPQTHGDPDTNGNGKGICFYGSVYYTGIALTALAISGHPDDRSATIGTLGLLTYREIAQDIADWLYFAQGDTGDARGGFNYDALDNAGYRTDNSNGGYAYLGLAFAEDPPFSCVVPDWVRNELNIYIDYIQNDVNGDTNDGGSGYDGPENYVNVLKTGNLIFEMAFYGDSPDTPRVQDAVNYLERHWQDPNTYPGWGYSLPVADYQAKFLVEKGLTYMGITELDTDGDGIDEDWFNQEPPASPAQDFTSVIVQQQQLPSGQWPSSNWDDGEAILSTAWAVLTLERFAPPPQRIPMCVEVHPETLNLKSKGNWITCFIWLPEGYDVSEIDPSTILLNGTVPAQPKPVSTGDSHLMVKFDRAKVQELILSQGIKCGSVTLTVVLQLYDGTMFEGSDTIRVLMPGDVNGDCKVDMRDMISVINAFGSLPGQPNWNPLADQNEDGKIDGRDISQVAANYGKKYK
jgi:hypothetical protein